MEEISIPQIQALLSSGEKTSRQVVEYYLDRIATIDRAGPCLNAIIETNPAALEIADTLDAERQAGKLRSPLHGIPIVLKDNIDTHDRMTTTAGSLALEGSIPERDAFLVERLRAAGAIILAKANLSEWANFRSRFSSSGWSSRGGQTRNPYALDRNPCGSSSGSAVAVAANLCAAAIGTETDGSIVCPASTNGVVGLKPTLGLVSRSGIIPIAHSQDTAGPMARSVTDAAILLGAMTGVDPRDPETANSEGHYFNDYAQFLNPKSLQGARLGVARNFFSFSPPTDEVIHSALDILKSQGAILIDDLKLDENKFGKTEMEVLFYEFKADLDSYLAGLGPQSRVHSFAELIAFNDRNADRVMPHFGQDRMLSAMTKGPLTEKRYLDALAKNRRLTREEGIDALLQKHQLDAIVAPTGGPAWLTDWINGDYPGGGGCSSFPAVAGYPHITVPAGSVHGLPVGISFIGGAWHEPRLLSLAFAYEQASHARQSPQFLATIQF